MEDVQGWVVAIGLALVFVVLPAGLAVFGLAIPLLRARRIRMAERTPLASDACPACGQTDLEAVAANVTRCRACGFVGGDGIRDLNQKRRRAALEKLDPGQRRALAIEKLREAGLLLGTAEESLERASEASLVDISGLSIDRGEEKQTDFAYALRLMDAASSQAMEAAEAIRMSEAIAAPAAIEANTLLMTLDTAWLTDGPVADVVVHLRIRKAKKRVRLLRAQVAALLAQLTAAPKLT